MPVYTQGQQLGPNDLYIMLYDQSGAAFDPYVIYYEFHAKDHARGQWRVGQGGRVPFQDQSGIYYVSERLSAGFIPGDYYIMWLIKKYENSPLEVVKKQEFAFVGYL
jgi:hypothetical protein